MQDTLINFGFSSFYPCFNGIRVGTVVPLKINSVACACFYPCFNGIRVGTRLNNWYSICNYYSTCFYFLLLQKSYYIYTFLCIFAPFPHRFTLMYPLYINSSNFIHFHFPKKYPRQFFIHEINFSFLDTAYLSIATLFTSYGICCLFWKIVVINNI